MIRQGRDTCLSCSSRPVPFRIIETSDLRLAGTESSWQFGVKLSVNLNPSWLKISFLIIFAAFARILVSSKKFHCFSTSLNMLLMPSMKTMTTFFPSCCSCASGKCSRMICFNLFLCTYFLTPRFWRRSTYMAYNSLSVNIKVPPLTDFSTQFVSSTKTMDSIIFFLCIRQNVSRFPFEWTISVPQSD